MKKLIPLAIIFLALASLRAELPPGFVVPQGQTFTSTQLPPELAAAVAKLPPEIAQRLGGHYKLQTLADSTWILWGELMGIDGKTAVWVAIDRGNSPKGVGL